MVPDLLCHGAEAYGFRGDVWTCERVVVMDDEVEIRYVFPTSPQGEHARLCHLRSDYFRHPDLTSLTKLIIRPGHNNLSMY